MTTLTKTEAEAILERLTDKTLSFGCLVSNNHQADDNAYKVRTFIGKSTFRGELVYKCIAYDGKSSELPPDALTVLGHPVTLLDVLTKLDASEEWSSGNMLKNECKVLDLWRPLGFKTPLRDILEGATWEVRHCFQATENGPVHKPDIEVLKDEKVESLISFLIDLNL